jgi:response regulator RpfG family c-di-GMP phosphodiesterase
MHPTGNPRLIARLSETGLISPAQQESALNQLRIGGGRVEEALLDTQAISEAALLKFLAAEAKTRFVSTEKLARADIDVATLKLIPKKMAEQDVVFPVLFDGKNGVLSIVTPDPDDTELMHRVQAASGAKQVRALVARPAAVKAAIAKSYNGDIHSFALLDRAAHVQFTNMLNVFERNLVSEESMAVSLAGEARAERTLSEREIGANARPGGNQGVGSESFLETLNVLVSLLENGRPDLRGHSGYVARLVRKLSERIGLPETQTSAFQIAAYVHDLGKMSAYHLTALNVSEYEGHRAAAQRSYKAPLRLFETVHLPTETADSLEHMYERFDGKGIPGEKSGKEIPIGARILALADTYADITQNPKNPFRKTLRPGQACEVLERHKGTVFDPNLVDLFKLTVTGDDLKARLLANRHVALLVEPDPEESTMLELRMIEQGFEVRTARSAEAALKILDSGEVEIAVSEVDLGAHDGFALMEESKRRNADKVAWVFLSHRASRSDAQKAFELGAHDYLNKPVSAEVLVQKLKQVIEREARSTGARGVAGSLTEMGLPEMVQVLWHGRKTGSLKIRSSREAGELHFVEGSLYNALWGSLRGPDAFYAMLALKSGDFVLDPNFKAPQRVIRESPEALLLEGMRRIDEGLTPEA